MGTTTTRFRLRFTLQGWEGQYSIADILSRKPYFSPPKVNEGEVFINYVVANSIPKAVTLEEIKDAYNSDSSLKTVIKCIQENKWKLAKKIPEVKLYYSVRNELSWADGILLRSRKIVIPPILRQRVLSLAHEGHMGIVKCKARLRSKVWWPGIDKDTEKYIRTCHSCQMSSLPERPSPLLMTELPDKPWSTIGIDLCGPFPSGETLLVVIDYYSRFPFAEILHSTTASAIINRLFKIFSVHGLGCSELG